MSEIQERPPIFTPIWWLGESDKNESYAKVCGGVVTAHCKKRPEDFMVAILVTARHQSASSLEYDPWNYTGKRPVRQIKLDAFDMDEITIWSTHKEAVAARRQFNAYEMGRR